MLLGVLVWWWLCSNLYTYGATLSLTLPSGQVSRFSEEKWIFQMCYFICAIWHFFHLLWVPFFPPSSLPPITSFTKIMIEILVFGFIVERDYWHTGNELFTLGGSQSRLIWKGNCCWLSKGNSSPSTHNFWSTVKIYGVNTKNFPDIFTAKQGNKSLRGGSLTGVYKRQKTMILF